jgi:RNA polymerase sigma-70 factor (ECF subfamily)
MRNNYSNYTDEELVEMLNLGKSSNTKDIFDELYKRFSPRVYTYCRKILNYNTELAEDIFQETFIRFFESLKTEKNQVSNLAAFLIKIARNLCLNEKARKSYENIPLEENDYRYIDKSYEKIEISNILHKVLDTLPEQFREVLIMKEFMDMTYQEISDTLETSLPLVRIRIFRAKSKLRELMSPYIDGLQDLQDEEY